MNGNIIKTAKGTIEGFTENGVGKFYGVPFAQPPVGELRFKRAMPVESWNGVLQCKKMPPKPVQFMMPDDMGESEDCLYLNIWTPENPENCPVFVWIYGGGLNYGSNSDPSYDGENMAKSGVIYVAISYRVGVFGFYDFNAYDSSCDTNCAMSDMLQSLRFIKENIKAFGGNPDNITVAGESSGGLGVALLLASPAAKGLFQKAIIQSIPMCVGGKKYQKYFVDLLLEKMGKTPQDVKSFRELSVSELKEAGIRTIRDSQRDYPYIWMASPLIGDDLLPEYPSDAIAHGSAEGVDLIIGMNKDEGTSFIKTFSPAQLKMPDNWELISKAFSINGKEKMFDEVKNFYERNFPNDLFRQMYEIATDKCFLFDTVRIIEGQSKYANVWAYRFDFVSVSFKATGMGATHSAEIPYALNTTDKGYFSHSAQGTPKEQISEICSQMNGAWVAFTKTGSPVHTNCEWKKYDAENRSWHIFDLTPNNVRDYKRKAFELWKKIGVLYTDDKF